jgi:mannose-6-phosphate isomerase-like protein (cupin superfamily)
MKAVANIEDPAYTLRNLDDLEDTAPRFGLEDRGEVRSAREALDARRTGLTHYRWKPGKRVGFGHFHSTDEEIYVVVRGGGRMKLNDEVVDIRTNDALRVAPTTIREWEAGPYGLELIAFGTHTEGDDGLERDWWPV